MKKLLILFIGIILSAGLWAQQDSTGFPSEVIENLAEQIVENSEGEVDLSQVYDDLMYFYENKLNLNTATWGQLSHLYFLDDQQIKALLHYRKQHGQIISIGELYAVPGFTYDVIQQLAPFITFAPAEKIPPLKPRNILRYGRSELYLRDQFIIQPQKGYIINDTISPEDSTTSRYLGNKHKIYMRYKFTYGDRVMAGFTAEKDAGEQFFQGAQRYGFDFYSAHLQVNRISKTVNRLVLGDFQAQFGQGLVLWNGFAMSKSAYVLDIRRRPRGLRKYSSTDENRFFRGIGTTLRRGDYYLSVFASAKHIDASIQETDTTENDFAHYITSIQSTGYHRTFSEIAKRHAIFETVGGLDLSHKGEKLHWGITGIAYHYSVPLLPGPAIYQQNNFSGQTGANIGGNWFYMDNHLSFFGEAALSSNLGYAFLSGLVLPLHYRLQLAMLYRYYSPEYFAYYGGGFGEGSNTQNEQGIYFGLQILPMPKWKVSVYFDRYMFPSFRYRIYQPQTWGNEVFGQIDYLPSRSITMYLRYKTEIKPQNLSVGEIYPVEMYHRSYLRYNLRINVSSSFRLNSRIEMSHYILDTINDHGILLMQDLRWAPQGFPLTLNWRIALFDAPYNARLYAYENDVLYAFSVPAYFYKGMRTYLLIRYDVNRKISLWLRLASTSYFDRQVISGGSLNEIQGNTKSEVKIQLRIRL